MRTQLEHLLLELGVDRSLLRRLLTCAPDHLLQLGVLRLDLRQAGCLTLDALERELQRSELGARLADLGETPLTLDNLAFEPSLLGHQRAHGCFARALERQILRLFLHRKLELTLDSVELGRGLLNIGCARHHGLRLLAQ